MNDINIYFDNSCSLQEIIDNILIDLYKEYIWK